MKTPDKCARCPREANLEKSRESLDWMRQIQAAHSEAILDEETANGFAEFMSKLDILPQDGSADAEAVRQLMLNNFELLDKYEAQLDQERSDETRFCIGALRMRAKDAYTEYTVSICRSPVADPTHPGDVQLANVQTRTI